MDQTSNFNKNPKDFQKLNFSRVLEISESEYDPLLCDNQYELHEDFDYGLTFDNYQFPCDEISVLTDHLINDTSSLSSQYFDNSYLDNLDLNLTPSENSVELKASTLDRGISLFEEHLEDCFKKDQIEQSFSKEIEFVESIFDELDKNDISFILKERYRREKNNESSKKSRAFRKRKFVKMEEDISALENENFEIKQKIAKLDIIIDKYNKKLTESLKKRSV